MSKGEDKMSDTVNDPNSQGKRTNPENCRTNHSRDPNPGDDLWTDGLICAFEFVRGRRRSIKSKHSSRTSDRLQMEGEYSKMLDPLNDLIDSSSPRLYGNKLSDLSSANDLRGSRLHAIDDEKDRKVLQFSQSDVTEKYDGSHWVPIGWARISELVQKVQVDTVWSSQHFEFVDEEDDRTVADLAAPYWERPAGPIWWCHVSAGHPNIEAWLSNAQWLHPAISLALRDESRLISDRMKHLLYEVPVRVAGGLLFELLGQSVGDPLVDEDDIPIVLRSWQAQNFLVTVMHVKGSVPSVNVLGITEVQELLSAGGYNVPRTVHEVIAQLACRLSRWDDRLFRKSIFGAADEIELKFVNRRNHEDLNLFSVILNQEIRRLSRQVC
ncbi:uncharacterized protein LOC114749006 isoform X1 [Neltuma alba]|uniref:uncharacterized protein LOC114749006 isoform X1 n=1 Tax=Neltuma alba TaxID=207710 RepID=UPI0010A4C9B2|nr:uncharacterized protein LOC114749006 isoform X1 [Prosopis alba]XP_028793305.1 uncharacterized protein LOC114749006 isoform X1 [Prosopis alba]